jgi:hypothetical protein
MSQKRQVRQLYTHKCPFCGHIWDGIKPVVVSCVSCKRRFDSPQKTRPGQNAAISFIETELISAGVHPTIARLEAKRRLKSIIGFGGK